MRKLFIIACGLLSVIFFSAHSNAQDAFEKKIATIPKAASLTVWQSKPLQTTNQGDEKRLLLGTVIDTYFCSLSSSAFYRHGDPNRGTLQCKVELEGANWYLLADGPSHNKGTEGGAASASCQAMCIRRGK